MTARHAYVDCFAGVAGDMFLGGLLDAGWPLAELQALVAKLNLGGVDVSAERVTRGGLAATHVQVHIPQEAPRPHRHLSHVLKLIDAAGLAGEIAGPARRIFTRLAEAEARVHGTAVEKVHFHEVGADDALIDIVGSCAGLHALGITELTSAPIPTGSGIVHCAHGDLPIPAPATAELLRGVPLAACDEVGELTTPTGAAIVTTVARGFGPPPAMTLTAIGHGAGTRENRARPNVLRLLIGTPTDAGAAPETLVQLETQVDDVPGQVVAHTLSELLAAGALDAFAVPIIMKKGRPGQLLTVLATPALVDTLEARLFRETGTLGVRRLACTRRTLPRELVSVATRYGPIRVKVARDTDGATRAWPEYDDCAAIARAQQVPLREVQAAALEAWKERAHAHDAGSPG